MFDVSYCCAVFGHSHAVRLMGAYIRLLSERGEDHVTPVFKFGLLRSLEELRGGTNGSISYDAALQDTVRRVLVEPEPDAIVAIVKGSATTAYSLPRHPRPFDFVHPAMEHAGVEEGTEVIPYGLVKHLLAQYMSNGSGEVMDLLAGFAPSKPVFLVPAPPPVASEDFLARQDSAVCREAAARGANPRPVRRKFWLTYLDVLQDFADQHGATVIDLPSDVYDDEGFLAERFWDDATHGNDDYSLLLLETIDRHLTRWFNT